MENNLEQLLAEENELQFHHFNEETAWKIGAWLWKTAAAENLPVTVDIRLAGRQLFHAARPGTSADNDAWINRKIKLVNRTGHSSFYTGRRLSSLGKTIERDMLLSESEYAPHGGCFPIILKNTGAVGTITVSGLPQEEDHKLVVRSLKYALKKE
jgi:uncharacterized protein (UPF0303 family)